MRIFLNHIGYDQYYPKKGIIEASKDSNLHTFTIIEKENRKVKYSGEIEFSGPVDRWKNWYFWTIDFSDFNECGSFYIEIPYGNTKIFSENFEIQNNLIQEKILPYILKYFKLQRCSGVWNEADYSIPFFGDRSDRVDVHGGWFDASGDKSKYLSHLSYTNFMNPQQAPMVVWNLLYAFDKLSNEKIIYNKDLASGFYEEALYGADFLFRMQDKKGYFYTIVFDKWTGNPKRREICSYSTQKGIKSDDYQAGYRQGAGLAIAALAKVSILGLSGDYTSEQYLNAALKGFEHLEKHNLEYLNNHKENIIDDYCALLASIELYNASKEQKYLDSARKRRISLCNRLSDDKNYENWWRADDDGLRPYFHAVEAGLPLVSLIRYMEVEPNKKLTEEVWKIIKDSLEFELFITTEVNNPFGYARQYIKPLNDQKQTSFFFPHQNESGYWWQGENARLASLVVAARLGIKLYENDDVLVKKLESYALDQLNWILGLNPYNACFIHGIGRNNVEYGFGHNNVPGGISNGITSGFNDEHDIDFLPEICEKNPFHRWRWSEQWIPHSAWFLLAICLI